MRERKQEQDVAPNRRRDGALGTQAEVPLRAPLAVGDAPIMRERDVNRPHTLPGKDQDRAGGRLAPSVPVCARVCVSSQTAINGGCS